MPALAGIATMVRRLVGNGALRRVLPAFFFFNTAEYGTWVAILLYAYERTGPLSVGVVALIQLVPAALLAPAAAVLSDRYPRERILTVGYLVQAAAMAATGIAMLVVAPVVIVYGLATIAASSLVITRPTQSALLPTLAASPEECTAANGASGLVEGAGILVGPLLAAAILTTGTPATVFLYAAGLLVVAAVATIRLRPVPTGLELIGDDTPPVSDADGGALAGLRLIVADRDARLVVGLLTARMLMIGAADVLFVLLALELLDIGAPGAAILAGALGAGQIVGGAATFAIVGRSRLASVAAVGAVTWGIALATIGLTAAPAWAPLLVVLGGAGLAMAGLAAGSILVPVLVEAVGLIGSVLVIAAILPLIVVARWRRLTELDRRTLPPVRELALLRRNPIFRPLPAPQLESVARRARWLTTPSGYALIREGDPGDSFFVLATGALRVEREARFLRDIEVAGDGVGEIALLRDMPRTASVTTTADTTLLAIDRAPFLAAVTGHPDAVAAAEREVARRSL